MQKNYDYNVYGTLDGEKQSFKVHDMDGDLFMYIRNITTDMGQVEIERLMFISGLTFLIVDNDEDNWFLVLKFKSTNDVDKFLRCVDTLLEQFEGVDKPDGKIKWEYDRELYERFFNA